MIVAVITIQTIVGRHDEIQSIEGWIPETVESNRLLQTVFNSAFSIQKNAILSVLFLNYQHVIAAANSYCPSLPNTKNCMLIVIDCETEVDLTESKLACYFNHIAMQ